MWAKGRLGNLKGLWEEAWAWAGRDGRPRSCATFSTGADTGQGDMLGAGGVLSHEWGIGRQWVGSNTRKRATQDDDGYAPHPGSIARHLGGA
jgi:hypothetical protein